MGEIKKAAENYQKALTLSPSHLGAHRYLAEIYLNEDDMPRAMEHLYAMRLVCGATNCAEMDELESLINAYKKK